MESQKQERSVKEMKRVTKIIALASIFSFILSYCSLISSLQQKLQLLSMYTNLVDKKYMFLLCNGIVGFILGSFRGNSETSLHDKAINTIERTREVRTKETKVKKETKVVKKVVVALLEEKSVAKEEGRVVLFKGGEEEEEQEVQDLAIVRIDDHDDDNGMSDSLLSSEELNKRCEEFIRKMKAEIRGKR
ncbi:hypothetical protein CARUB_v10014723mg [Capsella rubella]|uniref:Transmembrane protein n=1 Tax=Capsella rubella TaxID=81985 RepID=R0G7T9_9BRAS|nr:uncharacterized protein LOC17891296 [Capsella rubella]EOA31531.1 hypothetical protein CARUB_v10014723mg [Capsella rubella]